MSDPFAAQRWTCGPEVLERARAAAREHGEEASALLALLRELAFSADEDGGKVFPGSRTLSRQLAFGRKRVARLLRALVAGGLMEDTGERRGRGGTPVYRLALPGTRAGPALGGPSSPANWPRSGLEVAPPMGGALPVTNREPP